MRPWTLRSKNDEMHFAPNVRVMLSEPDALRDALLAGFGIALVGLSHAIDYLEAGQLGRVLPDCWCDVANISLYYPPSRLLLAKTRAFIHFLSMAFLERGIAARLSAR